MAQGSGGRIHFDHSTVSSIKREKARAARLARFKRHSASGQRKENSPHGDLAILGGLTFS
jgi:hypothetical protein